ncbi:DNA-binding transcriptional regulator Cro [compost metagenome]
MKTKDVFDFFGGARQTAEALGISAAAVYQWGDEVPRTRQAHVEAVTKGKLKRDKGWK